MRENLQFALLLFALILIVTSILRFFAGEGEE